MYHYFTMYHYIVRSNEVIIQLAIMQSWEAVEHRENSRRAVETRWNSWQAVQQCGNFWQGVQRCGKRRQAVETSGEWLVSCRIM